jgi:hypothetical protein
VLVIEEGTSNKVTLGDRSELIATLSWKQPSLTLYKYGIDSWTNRWCHANIDFTKYGLVIGRYFTPITKVDWPSNLRTIVDCDEAFYRYAPIKGGLRHRLHASVRGWLRFHQARAAMKKYSHVFFCSERDCELFKAKSSSVLPNVVNAPLDPPLMDRHANTVLMVGAMWYPPNRLGVDWFVERCWPAVAARCPRLRLRIVGAGPAEDRQRWGHACRVEAPGFVDDLEAEYARSLFAIAPIHYGGGTCIKFLEAGAFRRPCITTPHVFEGFRKDFQVGESAIVAASEDEMVRACVTLAEDPMYADAVGMRAHKIVTTRYNVQRFNNAVRDAIHRHGVAQLNA